MTGTTKKYMQRLLCACLFFAYTLSRCIPCDQLGLLTHTPFSPVFGLGNKVSASGIVPKKTLLTGIQMYYFDGVRDKTSTCAPVIRYGISSRSAVSFFFPFVSRKDAATGIESFGFGNFITSFEYAFIQKQPEDDRIGYQATIYGHADFPAPESNPLLPAGTNSTNFILGITGKLFTESWCAMCFTGAFLPTPHDDEKRGNHFLYEASLGYALKHDKIGDAILFLECNGRLSQHNKKADIVDPNSGGNIIFLGPALRLRLRYFIFDLALQAPVLQQFNGAQDKRNYRMLTQAAWLF